MQVVPERSGPVTQLLLLALLTAPAADFPLQKLRPLTWIVDYEPFWSPDGHSIVLISSRHGGMKVHVLSPTTANGSDMRQLTSGDDEDDSLPGPPTASASPSSASTTESPGSS